MARSINDLPDLVIQEIFLFLDPFFLFKNIRLVNQAWKRMIEDSSFWNSIRYVYLNERRVGHRFIGKVLEKCRNLEYLVIRFSTHSLCYPTLSNMSLPRLKAISFIHTYNNIEDALKCIVKRSPHIRKVTFRWEATQEVVDILSQMEELSSLNLVFSGEGTSLMRVFQKCSKLEHVKICSNNANSAEELKCLLTRQSKILKTLNWLAPLDDKGVELISRYTHLSELGLECHNITENAIKLIKKISSLTSLSLQHNCSLSSNALAQLFDGKSFPYLKRLTIVEFDHFNDYVLETISKNLPNLEALHLSENRTTIDGVHRMLECCTRIRLLKIDAPNRDFNLSFLNHLPTILPSLTYLDLSEVPIDAHFAKRFTESYPTFRSQEWVALEIEEELGLFKRHFKYPGTNPVILY